MDRCRSIAIGNRCDEKKIGATGIFVVWRFVRIYLFGITERAGNVRQEALLISLLPKCSFAEIKPPKEKDETPKGFLLSAFPLFLPVFDCGVVKVVLYIFLKYCKASTTSSSVLRKEG